MVDQLVNSTLNAQRIANVEDCFGSSGQPLAVEGRVLVGEGVLTKMCRKKAKPRQFFLFNDILVYGNIMINKKKYNKQHIIPLEEVKLENLPDDEIPSMKNGWLIRTPTKSFAVYAATATEKSEWMSHINKCLEELLNKTGKKPSTEHAAVWVPDAEANTCMHCRKSQFTIINRKHHCRKCGAVVCANCSNKKFLLPSQSSKPLRVCLSCYDTLSRARVDFTPESMKEKAIAAAINNNPVSIPTSPMSQDSSQDDDSDDEEEEEEKTRKNSEHDPCEGMEKLTIDDKPTFYGDETKTTEGKSAATEIATAAVASVVIETTGSSIIHETSNQVTSSSSSTVHESSSTHSYSAPTDNSSSNAGGDSSCGGGDSGGGGGYD